jgi:prepilin-type N-terminal cleavage/methylation domain-containing protein
MKKQSGFTLVEIAIVLVIIGLLLGGVLKGQELINSAKVKNLANDFKQVPLFIYGYQDKYKRLPGDDPNVGGANSRFGANIGTLATTPAGAAAGNGVIEGAWDSTTLTDESALFWQHVRLANLASGSTDFTNTTTASLPSNAEGGRFGIQMAIPIVGMTGSYFACSGGIPFAFAQQLDTTLDDGVGTTGTVRAVATGTATPAAAGAPAAPAAVAYANGTSYTVCLAF